MNQIPIYQHPFVDIFKVTKLQDWVTCQKEGDVQENVWDQKLGKNYLRIQGSSSSSNYIQIPATKFLPKKALGLTGKFVYLLLNKPDGKNTVIHFDYMVNETRLTKVSLSNIYKEFKNVNGSSLQIPFDIQPDRWTVCVINVAQLLRDNGLLQAESTPFFLRSVQICSTINVRGVFTSDIQYQVHTLPKDMAYKKPKESDWFNEYCWFQYPKDLNQDLAQNVLEAPPKVAPPTRISNAKRTSKLGGISKQDISKKTGVKFSASQPLEMNEPLEVETPQNETTDATSLPKVPEFTEDDESEQDFNGRIQKTAKEIEALREDFHYNLTAKNIEPKAQVKLYQDKELVDHRFDPKNMSKQMDRFVLKPNPIMRLDRVVGWHPHNTSSQIYFNKDPKLSQEIIFSQANLLLGFYPPLQKQRLFYDRHTNNIDQLYVFACPGHKNYSFSICKSMEEKSKDNEVTIWSLDNLDTTNVDSSSIITFKPPLKSIHSVSISCDGENLCFGGKDHQARDVILVYKFQEMIRQKKVEILARQLVDFEAYSVKFNSCQANSIIVCGKENIKFYKVKNGHLPGQAVVLSNTARGKIFTNSVMQYVETESQKTGQVTQKPSMVFVTSADGLLFYINYNTRTVEKIIQIHDSNIIGLCLAINNEFYVTAAEDGILRIWSTDFDTLKSEVNTGSRINHIDINYDCTQICVLSHDQGTISVLDLENSSYNVIMRSHLDNIVDIDYNQMTGKLVSIAEDYNVKVWHAETMEQVNEFVSENDLPIRVVSQNQGLLGDGIKSQDSDSLVAIGFRSGYLRLLDLDKMEIVHETLLFQSPLMDIKFSLDNRFLAVNFKSGVIVIINKSLPGEYQPIKNITYEMADSKHYSLSFSFDSTLFANISSNANIITVWETKNFSLRYHLDLTGDIIQKQAFAPNGKDLVILTTSSKLKFYRLGSSLRDAHLMHVKDTYGVTDMECQDFQISSNNRFILAIGKEGTVKVFDYFMRGEVIPSSQAFMGHFKFARKLVITKDMKFVFTIGDYNGLFKWIFYGDKTSPEDLSEYFEELESEKIAKAKMSQDELEKKRVNEGVFDQQDLADYTQKQIENLKLNNNQAINNKMALTSSSMPESLPIALATHPFTHTVDINRSGYAFEQFELSLSKLLACSNGAQVKNNLVWHEEQRYMCYSVHNLLVIEYFNQQKTQKLIKEGNDQIYNVKLSPSKQYLLAYSKTGPIDGFPCIYIFDSVTFKKLNQIAISDGQIDCVEFSWLSNLLLVISSSRSNDEVQTTLSVWDFIDGHKDIFCKSMVPIHIRAAAWNPYTQKSADEFVTISDRCYHYWRITPNLQLQYQEGELPTKAHEGFRDNSDFFTSLCFVKPDKLHHSVYCMIGLKSGYLWLTDARVNQFLFNVKVLDDAAGGVNRIFSSHARIVIESISSPVVHCWDQSGKNGDKEFSPTNPYNFFMGVESTLSLDGNVKSSFYNDTGHTQLMLSTSGSIWYLSWIENVTLRLKYCHNPFEKIIASDFKYVSPSEFNVTEEPDSHYTFDQNYQVSTSTTDGQIKLWNLFDIEYCQQFIMPKEKCVCLAMHQFKPFMVTSFSDGQLRFFDLHNSKLLGRCQIHSGIEDKEGLVDYVISIKILPSGNHIFAATKNGQIMLIFVKEWLPLNIRIESLVSIQTQISSFDFSQLEPYNKWLVGTGNGKCIVYNRKDFNSLNQEIFDELKPPTFNFMDSFNLLDYCNNSYSQTSRCNTLDHYYSMAKRNLVFNEVTPENEVVGVFVNNDLTLHMTFIKNCNQLFFRNFELHQVIKRLELHSTSLPIQMQLLPGTSPFICVSFKDNSIKLVDFMNEANSAKIQTLHEELTCMKVCPNGRYVLTGGNRGDICIWQIKKRILGPETMLDALHLNNA